MVTHPRLRPLYIYQYRTLVIHPHVQRIFIMRVPIQAGAIKLNII
jgi:hypothetical protein